MTSRIGDIVIKARNPESLGRFWCAALGYRITGSDETGVAICGAPNAPTMLFLRTDEDVPRVGTPLFDLCPTDSDQLEEMERLLSLGATATDVVPSGSWHVLADPEGNEFCLLAKRIAPEPEDFHDS